MEQRCFEMLPPWTRTLVVGWFLAASAGAAQAADAGPHPVAQRKNAFLVQLADDWKSQGYPIDWAHEEWKFNEVAPNWAGALAAMRLKRSPEEISRADAFFAAMPLDTKIDPDMRVCEALHAYYLFRDDPDLSAPARRRLLEIIRFRPAPLRLNPSVWQFGATENHAVMGHVWCLLRAQIDRDHETAARVGTHLRYYIIEHIRKGWLEYNSPCYVEKDAGSLLMVFQWAEDPLLRQTARLGLDVLFAEHAALNLEGMLGGPACRVYGYEPEIPLDEFGHNSRRDARCSGSYAMMFMLFGRGSPWYYGVLGAPVLATSEYEAPRAVHALAIAGEARGSYVFQARRPGRKHRHFRRTGSDAQPTPEAFDARVYTWVTPDYILGSFQEVDGQFGAVRSLPLSCVLRMSGSPLRTIYVDIISDKRDRMLEAKADCMQHRNVALAKGTVGRAYLATDEFEEVVERDGWIVVRAGGTFAACRPVGCGYSWSRIKNPSMHGGFIQFDRPDAAFVIEVAQASDYGGDFAAFKFDVVDNEVRVEPEGITYESCDNGSSGPSAEGFTVTLREGAVPLVSGEPQDLDSYGTFDSKYLSSVWDSGIVRLTYGGEHLTINVSRPDRPLKTEESIKKLSLPYTTDFNSFPEAWVPFLNYWRLNSEQWFWDADAGRSGGALRHEAGRGAKDPGRGAHDAAITLRGGEAWTNYAFEADARADKGTFGLWFRADMHDEGGGNGRWVQGYYLIVNPRQKQFRLWRARKDGLPAPAGDNQKVEKNHFSNPLLLKEGKIGDGVSYGQWMRLRAEVRGPHIRCHVNGEEILALQDDMYRSGSIGFATYKAENVAFDNVSVQPLDSEKSRRP